MLSDRNKTFYALNISGVDYFKNEFGKLYHLGVLYGTLVSYFL